MICIITDKLLNELLIFFFFFFFFFLHYYSLLHIELDLRGACWIARSLGLASIRRYLRVMIFSSFLELHTICHEGFPISNIHILKCLAGKLAMLARRRALEDCCAWLLTYRESIYDDSEK